MAKLISSFVALTKLAAVSHAAQAETVQEDNSHYMAKVIDECKGGYLNAISLLHPDDKPGQAFENLTINVCLQYADFLPRK